MLAPVMTVAPGVREMDTGTNRRPAAYEAAALTNMSEYGMKKAPLPGWAKTLAVFGC